MFDNKWLVDDKYKLILRGREGMSRVLMADADLIIDENGKVFKDRYGMAGRSSTFLERLCAYVACRRCNGRGQRQGDPCDRCLGRGYTTIWKNLLTILPGKE